MIGLQKPLTVDIEDMLWGEKELVASVSSTYREFEIGVKLAGTRQIDLKPLVTHRFSLESIKEAFDLLTRRDEVVIKAVVIP
jgi:threonine dehydrogenase-like Zn-dependent dehydrogenase